jgi:hypothetical protein
MKFFTLLTALATAATAAPAPATDFFLRYIGGNDITTSQRLRTNTSDLNFLSPGVTAPPHNPADHFARLSINGTTRCSPKATLLVVPTNPHPPPVPGYYGLTDREEGIPDGDAYRLVYTYRLHEQGENFKYTEWAPRKQPIAGGAIPLVRYALRYNGMGEGEWRWLAVKEATPAGVDKWVPYYVRKGVELEGRETVEVDVMLEATNGPVNSGAPGGVEE